MGMGTGFSLLDYSEISLHHYIKAYYMPNTPFWVKKNRKTRKKLVLAVDCIVSFDFSR